MRSILLILSLFLLLPSLAQALSGRVVAIADGDTLTVLTEAKEQVKVRINGIDAPEKKQPFGQASKANLSKLAYGRIAVLEGNKRDRYGRRVGKILIDGRDVGLEQIRAGMAWHFKEYEREQSLEDRRVYAEAENEARHSRSGLWRDPSPTPPWEFRHPERAQSNKGNPTPVPRSVEGAPILGNKNSNIYHRPGCPDYNRVSPKNSVPFHTAQEAEAAGYRRARNCP